MSNRIKGHSDHTNQSLFHHGLIKLIICTVLQKGNRSWDHFLFWSGFTIEQGDHVKKRLLNKKYGFVKRFKGDVIEYLVQDNLQKAISCQIFRNLGNEDPEKALENEQEITLEDVIMEKIVNLNHEEDVSSVEQKKSAIGAQENLTTISCASDIVRIVESS